MLKCHCRHVVQLFGQPLNLNCRDVDGDYYQYGSDADAGDSADDGGPGGDDVDAGDDDAVKEIGRHIAHDAGDAEGLRKGFDSKTASP